MTLLRAIFLWWREATAGTYFTTWFHGVAVGRDGFGNRYYSSRDGRRRWVLYSGMVDASKVSAAWHGWLHHTCDAPCDETAAKAWHKPHQPNLSGTKGAYYPSGSLMRGGERVPARADYQAWRP